MEDAALYQLALANVPGIGSAHTKRLIDRFGDAKTVFRADRPALAKSGIHRNLAEAILEFSAFAPLEKELQIMQRNKIRLLYFKDKDYPRRLLTIRDFPPLLFFQGAADLNAEKIVSVVGTRRPTDQGKQITNRLIGELAQPNLLIISGLAFGIDAAAHAAALEHHVPTIAVLAHGLKYLYPSEHSGLAREMRRQGGLLTFFPYHSKTTRHNFAMRNRLIAALCDALIVVETGDTGGSLITANDAQELSKKIFAVPGRITDEKSRGCHNLIRGQKAELLASGEQLQASMGWEWPTGRVGQQAAFPFPSNDSAPASIQPAPGHPGQHSTPGQHSAPEQQLLTLLREKETLSIDELASCSHLHIGPLSVTLLNLEIQGLIRALPGKRYRLTR